MIDIRTEQLITFAQAARLRPAGRLGRPTSPSTVYRWATRGLHGCRLEAIRVGGRSFTSVEAVQRFAERLTAGSVAPQHGTPSSRRAELAAEVLARLGH